MKKSIIKILLAIFFICQVWILHANNIQVGNVALTGKNTTDHYIMVQFDLNWENSWRTSSVPFNYDAAWIFVKFRIPVELGGDGLWQQALLNNSGHSAGSGTPATIEPGLLNPSSSFHAISNPGLGAFFYRSANGAGNFSVTGANLRWNYGANQLSDSDIPEIQVFAVEMVNVPAGAFTAGSGGAETSAFTLTTINTADATAVPSGTGVLGGQAGGHPTGQTAPASMSWPNGYNSFYSMKYEISQQQYTDFLNTLTYNQQAARVIASPDGVTGTYAFTNAFRSGIRILTPGVAATTPAVYETTLPNVACGYLSYPDGAAYADWAGLRPMTELEYEKASRGIATPLANEYPWGSASIASAAYTLSGAGTASEGIGSNFSTTAGNAFNNPTSGTVAGPGRVGIFAANGQNNGRVSSGSTFWGIFEMGGNLAEQTVNTSDAEGRNFTGASGNGSVNAAGNANVTGWPGNNGGEITGTTGIGLRGGHFDSPANELRTSDRQDASSVSNLRLNIFGFRAVRTAPFVCGISEIKVNHIAGAVAPVNKMVSYGTATNLPGETDKCWITRNLGADQQATAVDDNTEASAGWYWQFNRKQGYKSDGTTVTPSWTVTSISESTDWQRPEDPCSGELGNTWRIPTSTEWNNVITTGNWTNWTGPWNSGLKLHGSGLLTSTAGSLLFRGSGGYFWSSTRNSATNGYALNIFNSGIDFNNFSKADAFSIRCIRSLQPTIITTDASSVTASSAVSGGTIIDDGSIEITARGVCWSTSSGPTIALNTKTNDGTGSGTFTGNPTGLDQTTTYYLRAYATTGEGTVYGNEVSFTTLLPCGTSLTINHVAGSVAPVSKSVTYGIVTNIPGAITKCWITQNLGADNQATAVNDATEASAGWYWQFNRKQGYKHDETTRTPNTTWINLINENSNWQTSNDPCNLELGSSWRLPTYSEWSNVNTSGSWSNWNGPWNSDLKLHGAGYLENGGGTLNYRGAGGYYWSSTQFADPQGRNLNFGNSYTSIFNAYKALGSSVRCLRD